MVDRVRRQLLAAAAAAWFAPIVRAQGRELVDDAGGSVAVPDPDFELAVRSDPLWQAVSAVRKGRVHLAPAVPFGWIDFPPSLNRLIGLRWLARVLYPDAFAEDLRPAVREFYGRFYHRVPDEAQLEMLLASTRARS
ncbi:MAG TPA: hypothetical protein VF420_01770 [Casimicrobiaceae bacterium]